MHYFKYLFYVFAVLFVFVGNHAQAKEGGQHSEHGAAVAYFAGGCFWCMEEAFEKLDGVGEVVSGYTGGSQSNPTYKQVAGGKTSHLEAIKVYYDPAKLTYRDLLVAFWRNVDPHDANGQFCDKGSHYRAAIFPANEDEAAQAKASKQALANSGALSGKIHTEIISASEFYKAETYHQDYYKLNAVRYGFYKSLCGRNDRLAKVWGDVDIRGIISKD